MVNTRALSCLTLLLSAGLDNQMHGAEYAAYPEVAAMHGVVFEGGRLTLPYKIPVQVTHNYIVLEAENYITTEPQTGHGVNGQVKPQGGMVSETVYIDFTEEAKYRFVVTTPGTYNLHFRMWLSFKGS